MPAKSRLDQLLVDRKLASSREKAKALIMAGRVTINDRLVTKAGMSFASDAEIVVQPTRRWASRGAEKLIGALDAFPVEIKNQQWLDIGQSTGGFTDLLLARGAVRVAGVDVGYGQLHERLRQDPRVTTLERTNARHLTADAFGGCLFDGAVIDVSFISLRMILPAVIAHIRPGGAIIALVKPQFEAGRDQVGKGGVVRDQKVIARCVEQIETAGVELGLVAHGRSPSPLLGPKGNQEVFVFFKKPE